MTQRTRKLSADVSEHEQFLHPNLEKEEEEEEEKKQSETEENSAIAPENYMM